MNEKETTGGAQMVSHYPPVFNPIDVLKLEKKTSAGGKSVITWDYAKVRLAIERAKSDIEIPKLLGISMSGFRRRMDTDPEMARIYNEAILLSPRLKKRAWPTSKKRVKKRKKRQSRLNWTHDAVKQASMLSKTDKETAARLEMPASTFAHQKNNVPAFARAYELGKQERDASMDTISGNGSSKVPNFLAPMLESLSVPDCPAWFGQAVYDAVKEHYERQKEEAEAVLRSI